MSIEFVCPMCSREHQVPPELAGRQARCKCGAVLVVPPLSAQPPLATPPNLAGVPPAVAPLPANPVFVPADPTDDIARQSEPVPQSKPAARLLPLARLFAEQRMLILGVGGGITLVLLLAWMVWLFSARGGISEAMRYFPNDCLLVATANVDEAMSSSIYQQMKKDLPAVESGEKNAEQELGIAPSNISRITLAMGGKLSSPNDSDMVMVIRLKKAVSAADIKANNTVKPYQKDVKYEETKIGSITAFEETYRLSLAGAKPEREHGGAFCLPESTLIVVSPNLEVLKKVLERGKSPEFSEGMRNAMSEADFSKTLALAVNVKGLMASETLVQAFKEGVLRGVAQSGGNKGIEGLDEQFLQNLLGLAVDTGLDSSKATVSVTLLCKDGKFAEDSKKILEGSQVVLRNNLKAMHGVPSEVPDVVDSIKFSVSGTKIKGSVQASLEPLSKWIKEQAEKK